MSSRLSLRLFIVSASCVLIGQTAFAQIPSANTWRASPLNYFGRFQGIGYSDGYHSCKGSECRPNKSWFSGEGMSSFYGDPTAPTPRSMWPSQPSYAQYQYHQQFMDTAPRYEAEVAPGMTLSQQPMPESLQPITPSAPVPMAPLRLQPAPMATPVPSPAPAPSPSDVSPYDIPRPKATREAETVQPLLEKPQTRRVIPGTHSLMISQGGQPARR